MEPYLVHYGTPRHSGRYPWGSGDNPYQHSGTFISRVDELRKQNFTFTDENGKVYKGDTAIAKSFGMNTTEFRARYANAQDEYKSELVSRAKSLREKGYTLEQIAQKMGYENDSSIRNLLNDRTNAKRSKAKETAELIKSEIEKQGMIDVGKGVETELGISRVKLQQALTLLEDEGYPVYAGSVPQANNPGKQTVILVACKPGTEYKEIYDHEKVGSITDYVSYDDGDSYKPAFEYPASMDSNRLQIRYAEQGGEAKDGVIELRRGVQDLSLGDANYAQVRILVDGTHYLKGMAVYSDDLPDGVDVMFNTNKHTGTEKMDVLKKISDDPQNPFGALIKEHGGQYYYTDENGQEKLGLINKRAEEGDWADWADRIPSQFLGKQNTTLIKRQLDMTVADKAAELDEIESLTNPAVKRNLLQSYAEARDYDASHLQAAALPKQKYHVILPVDGIKDNEVYAPQYKNGEQVVLIRYPHGGTFEIPHLKVNNNNEDGKKTIGAQSIDAIGINKKVADQLSGADFDGDTVMVIPVGRGTKITYSKPLAKLEGFDPKAEYPYREGMTVMKENYKQKQMGVVSNLITDMTLKGADFDEIADVVKHSMVVIDAVKHKLDYKQSEADNKIEYYKNKYQSYVDPETGNTRAGAATLLSRAKSPTVIDKRVGSPVVNLKGKSWYDESRPEGALIYKTTVETYVDKNGKTKTRQQQVHRMDTVDDARLLSSGTAVEEMYAAYANQMKALANKARVSMATTARSSRSTEASKTYAKEVASLEEKYRQSKLNMPRERKAQLLTNAQVKILKQDNPGMTKEQLKKKKTQLLNENRKKVGASRVEIDPTDKEWEAIQKGAISDTKLTEMLPRMNIDKLRSLATPKASTTVSQAKKNQVAAMRAAGYTIADIAERVGLSSSTISGILKGK